MFDSQKIFTPLKPLNPLNLRSKKFRLRSVDRLGLSKHLTLNKTSETNLTNNPQQEHPINMTQFVFDERKKRNEISRIIDDYFQQKQYKTISRQPKAASMVDFTKLQHIPRIRATLKARVSVPIDLSEIGKTTTIQTSMFTSEKELGTLPPIFEEQPETPSRFNALLMKMVKRTSLPNSSRRSHKSKKKEKTIEANEKFVITTHKSNIVKTYTSVGIDYLYLELRAYHITKQLEVEQLFTYGGGNSLSYKLFCPFRKMLYTLSEEVVNGESSYLITPSAFYYQLFNNSNQLLLRLIKSLLITLSKIKNRLINTNLNLSNLHYNKESLIIDSWANSCINEHKVKQTILPVLRSQTEWLISVEYLPPEFIESVMSQEKQYDLFENPNSIDMWSVGTLILQIITLIPLNAKDRFIINTENKRVIRRGLYIGKGKDLTSLAKRQRKLCGRLKPQLQKLGELPDNISPKVMELMVKMLRLNSKQRLTVEQGLKIIQ